jgi:hypothetical protein
MIICVTQYLIFTNNNVLLPYQINEENTMETINTITIEQLAEKLNGKLWIKGDMKRIYLDEGYNTKKMSTKTYVYQREDGTFGVSCKVDCPAQPRAWEHSQEQEVIAYVMNNIAGIIKRSQLILVDYKVTEERPEVMVYVKNGESNTAVWYTEKYFYDAFGDYPENVFDGIPVLTPIVNQEAERILVEEKIRVEQEEKEKTRNEFIKNNSSTIPSEGIQVRSQRFGLGVVKAIEEVSGKIVVEFVEHGVKELLIRFARLEVVA